MDFPGEGDRDADSISVDELHRFFENQAHQTMNLRRFLYRKVGLARKRKVLDAGCGTGVITKEISETAGDGVVGIDKKSRLIEFARQRYPGIEFMNADCGSLPFPSETFDLAVSHFFLMWADDPHAVLLELARVLKPGGMVVASAEPDYGGRIEYPENPGFGKALCSSLEVMGADTRIGRKLGSILEAAGMGVEVGISSNLIGGKELRREYEANKLLYKHDLRKVLDDKQAERILEAEREQIDHGKILTVPIFWAIGRKPL
ncbi:MAG: methyltransferase domain-containing protein [Actinobacteria bacterium]|nr:methyltransferase domain-containing protein [Actinomycetota bacterium]